MPNQRPEAQRIVISGIGLCTPLGPSREQTWDALCRGQSGLRWLSRDPLWDAVHRDSDGDLPAGMRAGGVVGLGDPPPGSQQSLLNRRVTTTTVDPLDDDARSLTSHRSTVDGTLTRVQVDKRIATTTLQELDAAHGMDADGAVDRVTRLACLAAEEAWQDAGLHEAKADPVRIGCVMGTSKGGLRSFAQLRLATAGSTGCEPLWEQFLPSTPASEIAARLGIRGVSHTPVAACATGIAALFQAQQLLRNGHCDIVLAGSVDASLQPALLGSFHRVGVLARDFDSPAAACRPLDEQREGFLVGEGAAVLVLESLESARRRSIPGYAELRASRLAADPTGLLELDLSGHSLAEVIQRLLADAAIAPELIDMVNLHGTATIQNDICESLALREALGARALSIPCVAHKSSLGHLLGAAGSVELALLALSIAHQTLPPTLNHEFPDADCGLNVNTRLNQRADIAHALKLSLGFGGHLGAAILSRL